MESILNTTISTFDGYYNLEPINRNLLDWLTDPLEDEKIKAIQGEPEKKKRDKLKETISQGTISATFEGSRKIENLKSRTGLICIDIDMKDNLHITNYKELKNILSTAPFVAYLSRSVSGRGLFAIVPIKQPEKHLEHFLALESLFKKMNIVIDPATKDITRMRCKSYDPNPYINHQAKTFERLIEVPKPQPRKTNFQYNHLHGDTTQANVERVIKELLSRRIDITTTEEHWTYRAFELISEFGANAIDYFHDVSSMNEKYNPIETDKKFNSCFKRNSNKRSIASFFYACQQAGIEIKEQVFNAIPVRKAIETPKPVQTEPIQEKAPPSRAKFDIEEFKTWYKTIPYNHEKIALSNLDTYVYNARFFANGRLKYIATHENYKGKLQNNRSLFIQQVQELRRKLSTIN